MPGIDGIALVREIARRKLPLPGAERACGNPAGCGKVARCAA